MGEVGRKIKGADHSILKNSVGDCQKVRMKTKPQKNIKMIEQTLHKKTRARIRNRRGEIFVKQSSISKRGESVRLLRKILLSP